MTGKRNPQDLAETPYVRYINNCVIMVARLCFSEFVRLYFENVLKKNFVFKAFSATAVD